MKSLTDTQKAILDAIGKSKRKEERIFASQAKFDFDTSTTGIPILPQKHNIWRKPRLKCEHWKQLRFFWFKINSILSHK